MNLPAHQMSDATYAEFCTWWPLFQRFTPQYVESCAPLSEWDSAGDQMRRWSNRLHTMKYECAKVMNELGLVPGDFLSSASESSGNGVGHDVLHNPIERIPNLKVAHITNELDGVVVVVKDRV